MTYFLEITIDKFTFKVASDRLYTRTGLWALAEGNRIRIGVSDYQQQRSGDVAFAEIKPVGTKLGFGDEVAVIETIKVNTSLGSPVNGRVDEVNPAMAEAPEVINLDPYGKGWLAILITDTWDADRQLLMDPETYLQHIKSLTEAELNNA